MKKLIEFTLFSLLLVFASGKVAFAATPTVIIPTPETGHTESDFAKDVREGIQTIQKDNEGQNNLKLINENEIDQGDQENNNVQVDEQIDQNEAQGEQEGNGTQVDEVNSDTTKTEVKDKENTDNSGNQESSVNNQEK